MSELDDFLGITVPRQIEAERTLHNGDAQPRLEMWSRNDPVTVLGAFGVHWSGWQEVSEGALRTCIGARTENGRLLIAMATG
jgi:hypothetical protein